MDYSACSVQHAPNAECEKFSIRSRETARTIAADNWIKMRLQLQRLLQYATSDPKSKRDSEREKYSRFNWIIDRAKFENEHKPTMNYVVELERKLKFGHCTNAK